MNTPAVTAAAAPAARGQRVLNGRELRAGTALEHTSRFADDRWVLTPAIIQRHERSLVLDFTVLPAEHRAVARELFYGLLSGPLPPGLPRVSITTVRKIFTAARYFLRWVAGREAGDPSCPAALARLRPADLDDFHRHLMATTRARGLRAHYRASVRLFWHYRATLSDPLGFDPACLDAWGEPNHAARGENRTARIPEPVMGLLLAWALRFADDFADSAASSTPPSWPANSAATPPRCAAHRCLPPSPPSWASTPAPTSTPGPASAWTGAHGWTA